MEVPNNFHYVIVDIITFTIAQPYKNFNISYTKWKENLISLSPRGTNRQVKYWRRRHKWGLVGFSYLTSPHTCPSQERDYNRWHRTTCSICGKVSRYTALSFSSSNIERFQCAVHAFQGCNNTYNHLTPEFNPSAQRCLTRSFYCGFCFLGRAFR
jgi:hypothetical protein